MAGKRIVRSKNAESESKDQISHDEFEDGTQSSKKQSNANESSKRRRTEKRLAEIQLARAKSFATNHLPIFSVGNLDRIVVGIRLCDVPVACDSVSDSKPTHSNDASISTTSDDCKQPCSTGAGRLRAWSCLKEQVGL
jgi:hypothetical protein